MSKIRCFVVDDNKEVREEIKALIEKSENMEFVGEAADGAEAIGKIATVKPDVTVLDIVMPVIDGFEAAWWKRKPPTNSSFPKKTTLKTTTAPKRWTSASRACF